MKSRKPIFILKYPYGITDEEFEAIDKELSRIKDDYHVVLIETNQDEISYDLLNGTFWGHFLFWLKNRFKK